MADISLADISLRYAWKQVLDSVSLRRDAGEVAGLLGPGGGGKTQLIKVMTTLKQPRRGRVELFGVRMHWADRAALKQARRRVGLQFQNFALFDSMNVFDNVAFSLRHGEKMGAERIDSAVHQALGLVGLEDAETAFPGELSGGMRRRVAIARVMAARPDLAVFDDPVAGLDPINSAKIMALLKDFAGETGCVTVIATHDLERLLPICTRAVAIFEGKVLYDGPSAAVAEAPNDKVRDFVAAATRH